MNDDSFATPAFAPAEALVSLKRGLRDLRQLRERGSGFELKGLSVLDLSTDESALIARLARRPAQSPQWDSITVTSSHELRRLLDEIKKRLVRWRDDEH